MSRATREAYGETLVELVREGHDIMAVDADLAGSTKLADFQKAFPKRFVDAGIAEQDMVGVAAGLSLQSLLPDEPMIRFAIPCVIPALMSRFALLMRELR